MDEEVVADVTLSPEAESPVVEATSTEYLGRWNRLVSTTNWEKGRIICEWRIALIEAGALPASYTDEDWSQRVGNVTPQHTGRLRRVYQLFHATRDQYPGLYWSHFQAALDWNDAEMWLEGAVQNGWSIAEMQNQRVQALGALEPPPVAEPADNVDEEGLAPALSGSVAEVHDDAETADAPAGEFEAPPAGDLADEAGTPFDTSDSYAEAAQPPVRPFENLPSLPAELHDVFEAFKLAIIHHRVCGWQEVSCDDVLAALDALRQLALAPAEA